MHRPRAAHQDHSGESLWVLHHLMPGPTQFVCLLQMLLSIA